MHDIPVLTDLAVIAVLGVAIAAGLTRLRLPTTAGLLLAGAVIGPYGYGLVRSTDAIEKIAEVGVVLLLFTIGLEFSLSRLRNMGREVLLGGLLQVGCTILVILVFGLAFGTGFRRGLFYGFLFALSSTAIVLRTLTERGELAAPHGRFIVGVLVFQDLCVVPMMLLLPHLSDRPGSSPAGIPIALGKAILVVAFVLLLSRFAVPRVLAWVDASRSRDIFVLAVLGLCVGTAWLTSLAGLSLALGAFLGGLVVADTEYKHRALGEVLPLRDVFTSIFFVSLGSLFDARVLLTRPVVVGLLLAGFLAGKAAIASGTALALGYPARYAWLAGVGLAQFSEFGFVLQSAGSGLGLIGPQTSHQLIAAGVLSMFLTPLLFRVAPGIPGGERILRSLERRGGARPAPGEPPTKEEHRDHVILAGHGVAGRLLAAALSEVGIPYVALDLNSETVRRARAEGRPFYYADTSNPIALHHAGLPRAQLLVLLINDPEAVRRAVAAAQKEAPDVPILVRTRYLGDRDYLASLGADGVICDEVEAGIEMLARVLRQFEVPRNVIKERIKAARDTTQRTYRHITVPRKTWGEIGDLAELKIEKLLVRPSDYSSGRSLSQLQLRSRTGALVVAVKRGASLLEHPPATQPFEPGDIAYLVGTGEALRQATRLMETGDLTERRSPPQPSG